MIWKLTPISNLMKEEWREIKGYEGYYEVSNIGNIRSIERYVNSKNKSIAFKKAKSIKSSKRGDYISVKLSRENEEKTFSVHRLVALMFIPNPENKLEVNHIDGNKLNNFFSNLEWCTRSENEIHSYKNGLQSGRKGSKHHFTNLKEDDIIQMFLDLNKGLTRKEISIKYGLSYSNTCKILKGRTWGHIADLISKGEAIDVNTLDINPYK